MDNLTIPKTFLAGKLFLVFGFRNSNWMKRNLLLDMLGLTTLIMSPTTYFVPAMKIMKKAALLKVMILLQFKKLSF